MLKLKLQYFGHSIQGTDLFGKDADASEDWRQKGKGTTKGQFSGWHHWLNSHEFEQILEVVKYRETWLQSFNHKDLDTFLVTEQQQG